MSETGPQRAVDEHFDRRRDYWRDVYAGNDIESLVYRRRMETALGWVDQLNLPAHASALDLGCGAGLMTVALATRGMEVAACDASTEMVRQAQQTLEARGLGGLVQVVQADAHQLPFASASAGLIVALGLIPWLSEPRRAVHEMARVLEPNGWLLLTADNALRLNALTDPSENPLAAPLRPLYRALEQRHRRRAAGESAAFHRHRPSQVKQMLREAGLHPMREATVGFGPFTFMGRTFLRDQRSVALNRRLEDWAQRHPQLRRHGWHYLVAAQRGGEAPV